jgi:hypothetical protein
MTLLVAIPTLSLNMRSSISKNLGEIIDLHEELLGDLHEVVPNSEYNQDVYARIPPLQNHQSHHRWRSLDAVPEHSGKVPDMKKFTGLTADADVASDVAKVFGRKVRNPLETSRGSL